MTDKTVAVTIANQIGKRAMFMIGARNLACTDNALHFKVGRNAMGVTHVVITLNGMDLYDMEFLSCRGASRKVKAEANMIYADQLREMIETHTGLYTSL